ncbi:taste receptor type 2 member 40-like [Mantella aurantiaca]
MIVSSVLGNQDRRAEPKDTMAMSSSLMIVRGICLSVTFILGVFLNSLIAVIYFKNWGLSTKSRVCERILLSTAVTNVLLQCSITFDTVLYTWGIYVLFTKEVYIFDFVNIFLLIEFSFWQTCWLSIYYCLKIVKFSYQPFLWIQTRFSSFVAPGLMVTATGSLLINLPFIWTVRIDFLQNVTSPSEKNYDVEMNLPYTVFNMMAGCGLPFLLTLTSMGLSVTYLLKHVFRVKGNGSHFRDSQLEAHIRAVRTMVLRLILDLTFCLIISGSLTSEFSFGNSWNVVCWILVAFYPTAQSVLLILGNSTLKATVCSRRVAS